MEFEIHPRNGFIEVVTHGDGDVDEFQKLLGELFRYPEWKPGFPILINHADLNAGPLNVDEIKKLADMVSSARDELGPSRMALFVPGDLQYGLGRMWQVFVEDKWKGISKLFRSREEAVSWLMHE